MMTVALRTTSHVVQGDVHDWVDVYIAPGVDTTAVTDAEGHLWRRGTRVTVPASYDTATRTARVELGATPGSPWLPDVELQNPADEWKLEVELTWADGTILTFPSEKPLRLVVRRQGD